MHADGKKLLNLMFKPGETVSVTPDKAGYHSVPLDTALGDKVNLLLPSFKNADDYKTVSTDVLLSVALNPIQGWCRDINSTAFRNYLIELDTGTIEEQIGYIKASGIPYSAMIFSGGKSVHILISLSEDLPDEKIYRKIALWILNILPLADDKCKNPSRKIRIPGAERTPGKFQELLEFKGKVNPRELGDWLNQHESAKPKDRPKRERSDKADISQVRRWAQKMLTEGFPLGMGRNAGWFALAAEFSVSGFTEEQTIELFEQFYVPEHDFKEKEWLTAIASGFKHMEEK